MSGRGQFQEGWDLSEISEATGIRYGTLGARVRKLEKSGRITPRSGWKQRYVYRDIVVMLQPRLAGELEDDSEESREERLDRLRTMLKNDGFL